MSDTDKPADKPAGKARATVAPRRTVQADGRNHGPGAEVTLPKAEIDRLRRLGYLLDPKAVDIEATGATISTEA